MAGSGRILSWRNNLETHLNLKTMLWNLKFTLGVVESMNIFKLSSDMLTFYLCFRKVTETAV